MNPNLKKSYWSWISRFLAFIGIVWAIWLLWEAIPLFIANIDKIKFEWLTIILLGNTISTYLIYEAFFILFNILNKDTYSKLDLANLYFTGQIFKHLPGRVWGIVYQSTTGYKVDPSVWIVVNSKFMLLSLWFSLWMTLSCLAIIYAEYIGWLLFIIGIFIYHILWNKKNYLFMVKILKNCKFKKINSLILNIEKFSEIKKELKIKIFIYFLLSWIIYFTVWAGYGVAWPGLNAESGILLCCLYTLAWFIGYISLVTPSGIGVREVSFIYLAKDFPPDAIAGMAILGRTIMIFIDIFLGILFATIKRVSNNA